MVGWKIKSKIEVEPNSELGNAIAYFLKHWNGLTAFLRIAGASLSNAEVERLVKKCVLRRKGSMFYKTEAGAWIGDILMSLIETARLPAEILLNILLLSKNMLPRSASTLKTGCPGTIN
ncbi:MAG: transposase [Bdellovibrionales bacterium]|nr:transposase [Bdellovibrionales bacterium]